MFRPTRNQRIADEEAREHGLSFSLGSKLLAIVYFAALLLVSYAQERAEDTAHLLGSLTGAVIASVIMLSLPILIVWFISKSRRAADTTCFAVILLLFFALFGRLIDPNSGASTPQTPAEQAAHEKAWQELDTTLDRARERSKRVSEGEIDPIDDSDAIIAEFADAADRIAATGGSTAQVMAFIADRMRGLQPYLAEYLSSDQTFQQAGGIQLSTFPTKKSLDDRIHLLDRMMTSTQEVKDYYLAIEPAVIEEMNRLDFTEHEKEKFLAGFRRDGGLSLLDRFFKTEIDLYVAQREILVCLRETFLTWSVNQEEMISFQLQTDADKYDVLYAQVEKTLAVFSIEQAAVEAHMQNRNNR